MKFLVVEDEDTVRKLLSDLLRHAYPDAAIFEAKDGAEGLSLAKTERPDLIVSDVQMPAVNGIEFIEELRKQKIRTRVILYTGAPEKIAYQVAKLGVSCVLTRPFVPDDIYAAVKRALVCDGPLSLYGNDSEAVQEVVRENSELRNELECRSKEATKLREEMRNLSQRNFELTLAIDKNSTVQKQLEAQAEEIASLRDRLRTGSRRDRLELVAVRVVCLLVVISVTVVLYEFGMISGGSQLYLLILFLLMLLPFDRIKSLVGKFKNSEAHAEFSSEPQSTGAHVNPETDC